MVQREAGRAGVARRDREPSTPAHRPHGRARAPRPPASLPRGVPGRGPLRLVAAQRLGAGEQPRACSAQVADQAVGAGLDQDVAERGGLGRARRPPAARRRRRSAGTAGRCGCRRRRVDDVDRAVRPSRCGVGERPAVGEREAVEDAADDRRRASPAALAGARGRRRRSAAGMSAGRQERRRRPGRPPTAANGSAAAASAAASPRSRVAPAASARHSWSSHRPMMLRR